MPTLDEPILNFDMLWQAAAYTRDTGKDIECQIAGIPWIVKSNGMAYKSAYDLLGRALSERQPTEPQRTTDAL